MIKIKARQNKFHRINPNGVLCDKASLEKLQNGKSIEVTEDVANELLSMGFVKKESKTKKKKELNNG